MQVGAKIGIWHSGMPYDAEVEYIESTGEQYIDTGYIARGICDFDVSVIPTSLTDGMSAPDGGLWGLIFGANPWKTNNRVLLSCSKNTCFFQYNDKEFLYYEKGFVIGTETHCLTNGSQFQMFRNNSLLSSKTFSRTSIVEGSSPIWLFDTSNNSVVRMKRFIGKMKYFKLLNSGEIYLDLIPVRFTNENGVSEGAMYDKVSRKLFRNAGSGVFIIGPDKVLSSWGGLYGMKN